METQTDLKDGFRRQRRNFIAISVFIIFYRAVGVEFQSLNFLGNQITIHKSSFISLFVLTVFFYYAWRYTSYLNGLPSSTGIKWFANSYDTQVHRDFDKYLAKLSRNLPKQEGKNGNKLTAKLEDEGSRFGWRTNLRGIPLNVSFQAGPLIPTPRARTPAGRIFPLNIWCIKIRAFYRIAVNDHGFGEYVFPYILAYLAVTEFFHCGPILPLADWLMRVVWKMCNWFA